MPVVDTARTPPPTIRDLPTELLHAATAILGVESEVLIFGRFSKTDFETALQVARQRWTLAMKFDRALWLWSPGAAHTPREIARAYGVADPQSAEKASLDAVWLWPDIEDQETVAEKFWSMHESVATAQAEVERLQADAFLARQKKQIKAARRLEAKLANPKLRARGVVNLQHLHPELWARWAILKARAEKDKTFNKGWRDDVRTELGRLVPRASGRLLDYDAPHVLLVFSQCLRWIDNHKKNFGRFEPYFQTALSRSERAYVLTALVLRAAGYVRAPGEKQIRKLVASSQYLKQIADIEARISLRGAAGAKKYPNQSPDAAARPRDGRAQVSTPQSAQSTQTRKPSGSNPR
jgi:hypothetical protein